MKLGYSITAALMGSVAVVGLVQLAVSLPPIEINEIAKQITVRIDGAAPGTGVIVKKEGDTYTVLTNHHVVKKAGKYTAQTADGKRYPVNAQTIKKLGNVDLAVFQFTSSESYQVAELGDSDQISEGIAVYTVGWTAPDAVSPNREFAFVNGSISRRLTKPRTDGYALVYTNVIKPGMSGGAALTEEGRLVGINGVAIPDLNTGGTDYLAIPIKTYIQLAKLPTSTVPSSNNIAYNPGYNFNLTKTLKGHSSDVNSVAISPDGDTLASGSKDKTIKIWDIKSGELRRTLVGHSDGVNSVAISPDGQTLASGSYDKTIKIWDIKSGELRRTLAGHSYGVRSIAISPDGRTLASASSDIKLWDIISGKLKQTLNADEDSLHLQLINSIAISTDGKTLVTSHPVNGGTIRFWDLTTGELRQTIDGRANSVAISPDGKSLLSGSPYQTIDIIDLRTGEAQRNIDLDRSITSVAISADGKTLVSGSYDKTIKLWDTSTWKLRQTLPGHSAPIASLAISPDGRTLVSGCSSISISEGEGQTITQEDHTIKIWRLAGR